MSKMSSHELNENSNEFYIKLQQLESEFITQRRKYIFYSIIAFIVLYLLLVAYLCYKNYKRSKKKIQRTEAEANSVYCINAPVVVTSATHTAPGGYPVTQLPATNYQTNVYATPYPAQTTGNVTVQMPMPMPHQQMQPMPGMQTHVYPPMPMPGAGVGNMNPPTYDMAVAPGGPSVVPGYEKQSPYNPNFSQ